LSVHLTKLQKQLCNALQGGLGICSRPFADLAEFLSSDEETVLREIKELKKAGVIRRISALINYRALGLTSTLAAGHVPQENLQEVTEAVNSLESVSHNYLRQHYYNLWFTLQGQSHQEIEVTLSNLSGRFGIDFYSLPVERVFKLDVRFDAENEGQLLIQDAPDIPKGETVELGKKQKRILWGLQNELGLTSKPFDFLCGEGLGEQEVLRIIAGLVGAGVIRRIAGVVNHRKLGFVANVLFCCEVGRDRVVGAGERLARFGIVSHCYQRKPLKDWPYNLFAMMHGRSMGEIQHVINRFVGAERIDSFELLPTEAELKKQPVKYKFRDW
jgi:DNA-binding Lrp family transcriptional regulator